MAQRPRGGWRRRGSSCSRRSGGCRRGTGRRGGRGGGGGGGDGGRDAGELFGGGPRRRERIIDPFLAKIEEWVERSHAKIRADVAFDKLTALGCTGSERTVRRAVAEVKANHRRGRRRVYRPPIPEPGMWAQWDCDTCRAGVPAEFWPMFWSGSRGSDAVLPRDAFHVACTLLDCGDRAAQAGTIARGQVFSGGWCGTVTRRWTGRTQPLRATHSAAGRQDHPAAVVQGRPLFPSRCQ